MWLDTAEQNRNFVWENFVNGSNVLFMDPYVVYYPRESRNLCPNPVNGICSGPDTRWDNMRDNMGYALSYTEKMNFTAMRPHGELFSTGYGLANPVASGAEYLGYAPSGGAFTVDLSSTPGQFTLEWFNPSIGTTTPGGVVAGGAIETLTPPFTGDAVAYLKMSTVATSTPPTPPSVPTNLQASNVATTSATISWSLSTSSIGVAGYLVFKNGVFVATTSAALYQASGLSPATTYSYTVDAFDAAGDTSAQSAPVTLTTLTSPPPPPPNPISYVQSVGKDCGSVTSCTLAFSGANAAGDLLIVAIRVGAPAGSTVTVTDTLGDSYQLAKRQS